MPFITVKMAEGRTIKQKQEYVEAMTRETVCILNVKPEWVTVVFDEYSRENLGDIG